MSLRIVLDTNTVISALLWRGVAHRMLVETRNRPIRLYASQFLLEELALVLSREKFAAVFSARETSRAVLCQQYRTLVTVVHPRFVPEVVKTDPADDHVLACALEANADVIVSGNRHLLSLNPYAGIEIVNAGDFLARVLFAGNG